MSEMDDSNGMRYPKDEIFVAKDDIQSSNALNQKYEKNSTTMTNSVASALDDSTPSDSGVQLMDSMSSDMNESFMSNYGLDYDGIISTSSVTQNTLTNESINNRMDKVSIDELNGTTGSKLLSDVVIESANNFINPNGKDCLEIDEIAMTKSDIDNSNVDADFLLADQNTNTIPDDMKMSIGSTFDTDAIVFRKKVKKSRPNSTSSSGSSAKKRVSFHEDILKNTKTDNIHIEHGFITYKGHPSKRPYRLVRNSWCSQGHGKDYVDDISHKCYRNACSDVLDYGQTDVFDQSEIVPIDNSGIFEYAPQRQIVSSQTMQKHMKKAYSNEERTFYHCKCSDSNSSLESNDNENGNNNNYKRTDYSPMKSSSCDCIGHSNKLNNNGSSNMSENCYFSDPCIETINEPEFEMIQPKSVWCKELKPKSSCLKKNFRETELIVEPKAKNKLKTFNVHQLPDMNHLFGSLRNMFTIPIPERGVPEGCEDLHNVVECIPETESLLEIPAQQVKIQKESSLKEEKEEEPQTSVGTISRSKRMPELSLFTIPFEEEMANVAIAEDTSIRTPAACRPTTFRNKFIVNCESTIFEHTGVFFENREIPDIPNSNSNCVTPQKASKSILSFSTAPLKQKISNLFSSFRNNTSSNTTTSTRNHSPMSASVQEPHSKWLEREHQEQLQTKLIKMQQEQMTRSWNSSYDYTRSSRVPFDVDSSMTSSIISNSSDKNDSIMSNSTISTSTNNTSNNQEQLNERYTHVTPRICEPSFSNSSSPKKKTQHLASPLRRKSAISQFDRTKLSPDLFCGQKVIPPNPMVLLNEEFDDLLTITTDIESNENDIEMVDYTTAVNEAEAVSAQMETSISSDLRASNQFLRPPSSKSSLINRFLRNVTQKKINDATVKKNIILSNKYKNQPKHFSNLYVKVKKPIMLGMMADFNAEIAQEMEANSIANIKNEDDALLLPQEEDALQTNEEFGVGVGEISIDIFDINQLHILTDHSEKLVKAFKLYTGYNLQGLMTPVLVFLTNKTLYVTDLVRNRLCNRFVLPYSELDVILIGPHGNTVLLSNSARDMQQVLLAGGPYPADGLVSSLEMCARRAGAILPAIGQLTFDHLAPLQKFVNQHCSASKNDAWIYYAVVSVPANVLTNENQPLGPNIKGPLMHRNLSFGGNQQNQSWMAGYFLLKAGVLYMFADSNKKLPSMVYALTNLKGTRRAYNSARPHCFEIMFKTNTLQLAAPDEYVASEWLQAVVQSASGLFENQEHHKTLGCTLIITSNHLITLREDFSSPLRRLNSKGMLSPSISSKSQCEYLTNDRKMSISTVSDSTFNDICSNLSTPSRVSASSHSSPMIQSSQISMRAIHPEQKSFSSISSIYGKNSGVEIKTCAALDEMVSIRIPAQCNQWWCILEFSCQEVRDCSDDMVIFFATNSDMQRFLSILESMWQTKNKIPFPISTLLDDDFITNHCRSLFINLNRSWEPLLSAVLGFSQ